MSGTRRALPVAMLVVLALVPAIALAGVWQYAEANVPPPTTTTTTTLPQPPVAPLDTSILSLRRHPTPLAERAAAADVESTLRRTARGALRRRRPGELRAIGR